MLLRSSMVSRGVALKTAAKGVSVSNAAEVTGWITTDVTLDCDGDTQEGGSSSSSGSADKDEVVWQEFADSESL